MTPSRDTALAGVLPGTGEEASRPAVFRPIPRRPWMAGADLGPTDLRLLSPLRPRAGLHLLLWRSLLWLVHVLLYLCCRMAKSVSLMMMARYS